jgi:hypothetical protein
VVRGRSDGWPSYPLQRHSLMGTCSSPGPQPPGGNFTKSAVDDRRERARPHNEEEDFKKEGRTAEARMRGRL